MKKKNPHMYSDVIYFHPTNKRDVQNKMFLQNCAEKLRLDVYLKGLYFHIV